MVHGYGAVGMNASSNMNVVQRNVAALHRCSAPQGMVRLRWQSERRGMVKTVSGLVRGMVVAASAPAAASSPKKLPYRIGHGWDLHRLEPGYPLIIGGIDIPHERGCVAHSDGDVLLHTVVDAILGALCLPDIGQLFPDNDPKWKGARSDIFLKEAVRLMDEAGYVLGNIDCTIIAQKPKLSPHKENIRNNLCDILGADPSVVNIKAKTHEKVDSLGENRSIACEAVVMLLLKE